MLAREILLLATCLYFVQQLCCRLIIVEDARVCFRRALAGKRVARNLVRRAVLCSSLQECQRECEEEKRFVCESFNYRTLGTHHRHNDCELIELPIAYLDHFREIHVDRDCDVYEKDRNANADCTYPTRYHDDRRYRDYSGAQLHYNHFASITDHHSQYYSHPSVYVSPWDPNPPRRTYQAQRSREGHSLIEKPTRIPSSVLSAPREIVTGYEYEPYIWEDDFPATNPNGIEHKHAAFDLPRKDMSKECSARIATGFKLHKLIADKSYAVTDIHECEQVCLLEKDFKCSTYAYRYTKTSSPLDNCFLTHKRQKQLNFYTDLEPQRDFDIYAMQNLHVCMATQPPRSDCFWHLRSGHTFDPIVVCASNKVHNIVECQLACLEATQYVCRGYSFGSTTNTEDNCLLTDWPFSEIKPRRHFTQQIDFEIYERGSFGHGCELNHFAIEGSGADEILGSSTDQLCYVGYGTPARLLPAAIKKSLFTNTEFDCKTECTQDRFSSRFPCMSFSFSTNTRRGSSNCHLSEIQQQDLLSTVDYKPDSESLLFAWDVYNPKCVSLQRNTSITLYDIPFDSSHHFLDSWRHYTVSGWPCRHGTTCTENKEAGFWFCHLEGGQKESWDYCCRPDHECGYSEGYNYQWCFVGPQRTQWRKCNEHYYPYSGQREWKIDENFQTPIDIETQQPGYRPRLYPKYPSVNDYEKVFDAQFLQAPPTGFFGQPRLWPVSYLHHELANEGNASEYQVDAKKLGRIKAIHNLIMFIKSNNTNDIEYSNNHTNLLIKIPLPANLTANSVEKSKVELNMGTEQSS